MRSIWPWVVPFLVFTGCLVVEDWFPDHHYIIASGRGLLVGGVILYFGRCLPSLRPGNSLASVLVGVLGVALWIGLDPILVHYPAPLIGRNPFQLYPPATAWLLFSLRLFGFVLVVPVMEELFWRGFLMRWLIKEDFTTVPLGTYKPVSFFVTTGLFAAVHGWEWPLAVVVGLIYGAWFIRTKNLGDIMLAHGVTNLLLGLYCLVSGDWHFLSTVAPPNRH